MTLHEKSASPPAGRGQKQPISRRPLRRRRASRTPSTTPHSIVWLVNFQLLAGQHTFLLRADNTHHGQRDPPEKQVQKTLRVN